MLADIGGEVESRRQFSAILAERLGVGETTARRRIDAAMKVGAIKPTERGQATGYTLPEDDPFLDFIGGGND